MTSTDNKAEKTTTDYLSQLFSKPPLSKVTEAEFSNLVKHHGEEPLLLVADITVETYLRTNNEISNPGGYLQSLCKSLVIPDWYVPWEERMKLENELRKKREAREAANLAKLEEEKEQAEAINRLWDSLSSETKEHFIEEARSKAKSNGLSPSVETLKVIAKSIAGKT